MTNGNSVTPRLAGPAADSARPASATELSVDRRRRGQRQWSAVDTLRELPALVVLNRLPVAALAVDARGAIIFANASFAAMVGYGADSLPTFFRDLLAEDDFTKHARFGGLRARADTVVLLTHADGSIVRAKMSRSALIRAEESVSLVVFDDVTEEHWERPGLRKSGS